MTHDKIQYHAIAPILHSAQYLKNTFTHKITLPVLFLAFIDLNKPLTTSYYLNQVPSSQSSITVIDINLNHCKAANNQLIAYINYNYDIALVQDYHITKNSFPVYQ